MKCEKCNVKMIDGSLYGKPRFIDIDHDIDKFYVSIKTGKKTSVLGLEVDETKKIKFFHFLFTTIDASSFDIIIPYNSSQRKK